MHAALADRIKDGPQPIVLGACVDAWAVVGPLAQCIADGAIQLLVYAALDAGNYVHRLEHVKHAVVLVDHGNAANVSLHHLMNDIEDRAAHERCADVVVGADIQLADGPLEEDGVVFVVDGNELEDAVLGNDGHHPLLAGLVVNVDKRDTSCSCAEHLLDGVE